MLTITKLLFSLKEKRRIELNWIEKEKKEHTSTRRLPSK